MTNPSAAAVGTPLTAEELQQPVASAIHTIALLAVLGVWAYVSRMHAIGTRAGPAPSHMAIYLRTLVFEWAMFAFVVYGIQRRGVTFRELVGPRWTSVKNVFLDIGIGIGFLLISFLALGLVGRLLHDTPSLDSVRFMAPKGVLEMTVWLLLSFTAGICEETIFRGYLQRQIIGWTKVPAVGIIVSGILFGAVHIYQGEKHAIAIAVLGMLLGVLAAMRRSLKPGMISHMIQDSIGGIVLNRMVNH
jgi:membrane protease YdiL (CAAX protease family)